MKLTDNNSLSAGFISSFKAVLIIYIIWSFVSYGVFHARVFLRGINIDSSLINYLMTFGFIFLATFLSLFFMRHVEKYLKNNRSLILLWLLITLVLLTGFYFFVRITGNKISLIHCLATANLIVFACIIGNWMVVPLKRPAEIVPLCVVAALADSFSVFSGPTKQIVASVSTYYKRGMEGVPPLANFLLVKIPLPHAEELVPFFGVSDWIIVVFLTAAAYKFGLNDNIIGKGISAEKETPKLLFFPIASAGLCLAVVVAGVAKIFVPALPFIVILYLSFMTIKYPELRKLTKADLILFAPFFAVFVLIMLLI